MVATVKKGIAAIGLTMVLLLGIAGLSPSVNAAMTQHHSSVSTVKLAAGGPDFYCPPPPFVCI